MEPYGDLERYGALQGPLKGLMERYGAVWSLMKPDLSKFAGPWARACQIRSMLGKWYCPGCLVIGK